MPRQELQMRFNFELRALSRPESALRKFAAVTAGACRGGYFAAYGNEQLA